MLSSIAYIVCVIYSSLVVGQDPYTAAKDSNGYDLSLLHGAWKFLSLLMVL